jgi:hypothetical protein
MSIDTRRIAIRDDAGNAIFVRRSLSFGGYRDFLRVANDIDESTDLGKFEATIMLLNVYVLDWEGPRFEDVPFSVEAIERELSPDEPIVQQVLEHLNSVMEAKKAAGDAQKKSTENGEATSPVLVTPVPISETSAASLT